MNKKKIRRLRIPQSLQFRFFFWAFLVVLVLIALELNKQQAAPLAASNIESIFTTYTTTMPDFGTPHFVDTSVTVPEISEKVRWITSTQKDWGDPESLRGGAFRAALQEFPKTFRSVGPDVISETRGLFWDDVSFNLLEVNPETQEFMPAIASHWAYSSDGQTIYYTLNQNAQWSDGHPITADDFVFACQAMQSPYIQDTTTNDSYTRLRVEKITDFCISITYTPAHNLEKPDLLYKTNIKPRPRHFYPNGELPPNFVEAYNRKIEPVSGPYRISDYKENEYIQFERIKDWWGDAQPQFTHYANFDTITYQVMLNGIGEARARFYKQQLDSISADDPDFWRLGQQRDEFLNGYVQGVQGAAQNVHDMHGMFFNITEPRLADIRLRQALRYLIDIQGVIDNVLYGDVHRMRSCGGGQWWNDVFFNNNSLYYPDFNKKQTEAFLQYAGYESRGKDGIRVSKDGKRLSFEVIYTQEEDFLTLQMLRTKAKTNGVELLLRRLPLTTAYARIRSRSYEIFWGTIKHEKMPNYLPLFSSASANRSPSDNFSGFSDPYYMDKLLYKYEYGSLSLVKKAALSKEIEQQVYDQVLMIPGIYRPFMRAFIWQYIRVPMWLNTKDGSHFLNPMTYLWFDAAKFDAVKAAQENKDTFKPKILYLSERYK